MCCTPSGYIIFSLRKSIFYEGRGLRAGYEGRGPDNPKNRKEHNIIERTCKRHKLIFFGTSEIVFNAFLSSLDFWKSYYCWCWGYCCLRVCVCVSMWMCGCVSVCDFTSIHRLSKGFICPRSEFKGTDQRCCVEDVSLLCQVPFTGTLV